MKAAPNIKRTAPKVMWILIDAGNGGAGVERYGHNYCWWFFSRELARKHKREHDQTPQYAPLVGPFRYVLEGT